MTNSKQYSDLEQNRIDKLERLRAQGMEPYPAKSERSHTSLEAIAAFEKTEKDENVEPIQATGINCCDGTRRGKRNMSRNVQNILPTSKQRIQQLRKLRG